MLTISTISLKIGSRIFIVEVPVCVKNFCLVVPDSFRGVLTSVHLSVNGRPHSLVAVTAFRLRWNVLKLQSI